MWAVLQPAVSVAHWLFYDRRASQRACLNHLEHQPSGANEKENHANGLDGDARERGRDGQPEDETDGHEDKRGTGIGNRTNSS